MKTAVEQIFDKHDNSFDKMDFLRWLSSNRKELLQKEKTNTDFIKVPVIERLPDYGQRVIALVLEQNDLGLSKYLWNVSYNDEDKSFSMDDGRHFNVEYWLEEVPEKQ